MKKDMLERAEVWFLAAVVHLALTPQVLHCNYSLDLAPHLETFRKTYIFVP